MLRLFVALPLPPEIQDELGRLGFGIPGAQWVPDENLHITLRFIGEVSGADAQDIDSALAGLHVPAFEYTIEGVGHFGKVTEARSIWAGIARNPALMRLRDKIESALVRAGLPPDGRKYIPHVTLARMRGETGHHLANFLAEHSLMRLDPVTADHFALYRSHTKQSGAIYEALAEYPLAGAMAGAWSEA